MKTVYLAHPYGGQFENICHAIDLGTQLTMENSDVHIFNAAVYFHQFKDVLLESEILKRCTDMVARCDELWLAPGWENSEGCKIERWMAKYAEKQIVYLPADRLSGVEG